MSILFVIATCTVLIWFGWRQDLQGRSYPLVGMACLYGIAMLATGSGIPLDAITLSAISLAIWIAVSVLWAEKQYAVLEVFVWISYLTVFLAARTVPFELVAWALIPNAAIVSGLQIYKIIKLGAKFEKRVVFSTAYPLFGNSNHSAVFLLIGLYASIWIAVNVTPYMHAISLLIAVAIAISNCRSAMLAMCVSLATLALLTKSQPIICAALIAACMVAVFSKRIILTLKGNLVDDRAAIYVDAFKSIHPKFITGRGINYFRTSHYGRVHNDHLELVGEIGIIGYLIFISIFAQMSLDPVILCAVIAYFIASLFFYPLREVHTAVPFWALVGAASGGFVPESFPVLKATMILSLIAVMIFVFTVFCNLMDWSVSESREAGVIK